MGLLSEAKVEGTNLEGIKDDLEANLQILTDRMKTIKALDDEILGLVDNDDVETEILEAGEYSRGIIKTTVAISRWKKSLGQEAKAPNMNSSSHAKLPKLKLKQFNGDPLTFQSFWDSFTSAVDQNDSLDDVTKFNYLKGLLEDKAQSAIEGLTLTSDNYQHAKELLENRFGDTQVIITAHMDALLAIKPVLSNNIARN